MKPQLIPMLTGIAVSVAGINLDPRTAFFGGLVIAALAMMAYTFSGMIKRREW